MGYKKIIKNMFLVSLLITLVSIVALSASAEFVIDRSSGYGKNYGNSLNEYSGLRGEYSRNSYGLAQGKDFSGLIGKYSYDGYGKSYGDDNSGLVGRYSYGAYGESYGKDVSGLSGEYSYDGYGKSYGKDSSGLSGEYSYDGYGKSYGKSRSDLGETYVKATSFYILENRRYINCNRYPFLN